MLIEQQPATPLDGGVTGTAEASEPQQTFIAQPETEALAADTQDAADVQQTITTPEPVALEPEVPTATQQDRIAVQEQEVDDDNLTMAELLDNPANQLRR